MRCPRRGRPGLPGTRFALKRWRQERHSLVKIELINTGSELLLGRVLNTHQQWICRQLADAGYEVARQTCVSDDGPSIQAAAREALGRADWVIATGGLGPTSDDLTRELLAQLLGRKLVFHPKSWSALSVTLSRADGRRRPAAASKQWRPRGL